MSNSESCVKSLSTEGSLGQGLQFATMTKAFHGGSRKNMRKNKKMNRKNSRSNRKMKGGSMFTPYADYQNDFSTLLPNDIRDLAKIAPLDSAFAELPAVQQAAGVMAGGAMKSRKNNVSRKNRKGGASRKNRKSVSRKNRKSVSRKSRKSVSRKSRKLHGGSAPIDEPSMLIQTQQEELDARLNPQWYTEDQIIPNFRGPVKGGRRY